MRQRHIYLFFINVLITVLCFGQEDTSKKEAILDTLPPAEKYGLRIGLDLSKLIQTAFNDNYSGFEIIADYRVYHGLYVAIEAGQESLIRDEENINTEGSGKYIRGGIDYNVYKNWRGMQNSIYVGLRYSYASFDQTLNDYSVFTSTDYFAPIQNTDPVTVDSLDASWLEFIFGIKAELFHNLYLGVNVSLRRLMNETTPEGFDNLFIPGFGKTNDFSEFGIGYSYTISYSIPFFTKKK